MIAHLRCDQMTHMPWPDLPPLGTLAAFEAVVRLGSTTRAGAELHLTHGAVSRQIAQLERAVGAALFERGSRTLVPTRASGALAETVRSALTMLDTAFREARPQTSARPVVLSCEPTLLMRWLIPRLSALDEQRPDVELHVAAAGGPIDMHSGTVDLALRRDDFPIPSDVHARHLFPERTGPVCAPGAASSLEHLLALPRLHSATRPDAWSDWARLRGVDLPAAPERVFDHFYLSLQAAGAGLGAAIGPSALVLDDIADGRLTAPDGFLPDGSNYIVLANPTSLDDPRIDALQDWLTTQTDCLRVNDQPPRPSR